MDNFLYHAMPYEHAKTAFETNQLVGGSTHRFHRNGTLPWPLKFGSPSERETPEYLQSEWYFGVCLTRSLPFAMSWNHVVLVLDADKLRARHKVTPYNWFETRLKAESEEFLRTTRAICTVAQTKEEDPEGGRNKFLTMVCQKQAQGCVPNLHRYLRKVIMQEVPISLRKDAPLKLTAKAEADLQGWYRQNFDKELATVQAYCSVRGIELDLRRNARCEPQPVHVPEQEACLG